MPRGRHFACLAARPPEQIAIGGLPRFRETPVPVRTGGEYVAGLKARPRDVWVGGEKVDDVTALPAFRRPVARLAELFDLQHGKGAARYPHLPLAFHRRSRRDGLHAGPRRGRSPEEARRVPRLRGGDARHDGAVAGLHELHAARLRRGGGSVRPRRRALRREHGPLLRVRPRERFVPDACADVAAERPLEGVVGPGGAGPPSRAGLGIGGRHRRQRRADDRDDGPGGRRGPDLQHSGPAAGGQTARAGFRGPDRCAGAAPDLPRAL